jgi:predicted NUDIX family NTP pyrophosphohydrolase
MAEFSAGILLYRRTSPVVEVLLIHPGGPYWRNRDAGAWMIPKGGVEEGEEPLACALREFEEEVGTRLLGTPRPLCRIRQKGGKWVQAFALEGDLDADAIVSNLFEMETPRGSGRMRTYPEVDRAAWFTIERARAMILPSQTPILDALEASL